MSNVSRRNLLAGVGAGAGAFAVAALVGHRVSWEGVNGSYPVRPYTLSAGAVEQFEIRERVHLSIDGLGSDVVEMAGTATFRRHDPELAPSAAAAGLALSWATAQIRVDFLRLDTQGVSSLFGAVRASLPEGGHAGALVTPPAASQAAFSIPGGAVPANKSCLARISPKFWVEALNEIVSVGDAVVDLASNVSIVPPVGDVARTTGQYALVTEDGKQIGTLMGADIEIGRITNRQSHGASAL